MKGMTFYVVFGQYAGFRTEISPRVVRLVLGWVSLGIWKLDIEVFVTKLIDKVERTE